jgi:hypothetical protein
MEHNSLEVSAHLEEVVEDGMEEAVAPGVQETVLEAAEVHTREI